MICLVCTVQTSVLAHILFCSVLVNFSCTDQGTCTYSVLNSSCKLLIQLRQYLKKRDNSGVTDIDEIKYTAVVVDYKKSSPVYDKKKKKKKKKRLLCY